MLSGYIAVKHVLLRFIRKHSSKDVPDDIREMIIRYSSHEHPQLKNIYTARQIPLAAYEAPQRHFSSLDEVSSYYEPIREIGCGERGVVYQGRSLMAINTPVTIKMMRRGFHTESYAKRLVRELRILRILRNHDSIVRMLDIIPPKNPRRFADVTLVFELPDTDLSKIFRTKQFFSSLHVQYMLYQILLGVKYMHSAKIAHRNLEPANLLISEDCSVKICDFGQARGFNEFEDDAPRPEGKDEDIDEVKDEATEELERPKM